MLVVAVLLRTLQVLVERRVLVVAEPVVVQTTELRVQALLILAAVVAQPVPQLKILVRAGQVLLLFATLTLFLQQLLQQVLQQLRLLAAIVCTHGQVPVQLLSKENTWHISHNLMKTT
jgi:hypothetical protein